MALFFVTYVLLTNNPYLKLYARLEELGACKVMLFAWVLRSNSNAYRLEQDLTRFINRDDLLLVIEAKDWAGWNLLVDPDTVHAA